MTTLENSQHGSQGGLAAMLWLVQNARRSAELVVAQSAAKSATGAAADQALLLVVSALCDALQEMTRRAERLQATADLPDVVAETERLRAQNAALLDIVRRLADESVYQADTAEGTAWYLGRLIEDAQALMAEVEDDAEGMERMEE